MKSPIFALSLSTLLLSACSGGIIPYGGPTTAGDTVSTQHGDKAATPIPSTPTAPLPAATASGDGSNAASLGVVAGPRIGELRIARADGDAAMAAFRTSCPGVLRREDLSGLTQRDDWQAACDAVKTWTGDGVSFFAAHMDAVQVGDGKAFATGYYEPEILASRTRGNGYETPIYKRPPELIEVDLGTFASDLKGRKIRGEVKGSSLVQFADRTAIEEGKLAGRSLEIAYAKDPVEFFFLQIQGSGRLRFADGTVARIGYDNQNGHPYTGIGKLMKDRGLAGPCPISARQSRRGKKDYARE
jgi:membrane-bound lytic murein transglycosylase A